MQHTVAQCQVEDECTQITQGLLTLVGLHKEIHRMYSCVPLMVQIIHGHRSYAWSSAQMPACTCHGAVCAKVQLKLLVDGPYVAPECLLHHGGVVGRQGEMLKRSTPRLPHGHSRRTCTYVWRTPSPLVLGHENLCCPTMSGTRGPLHSRVHSESPGPVLQNLRNIFPNNSTSPYIP